MSENRDNRTKRIGTSEYTVTKLGGLKGSEVFVHLVNLFGPGAGGLKSGGWLGAIERIATKLTVEEMRYFCDTFAPLTIVKLPSGKSPKLSDIFDEHFDCNYSELVQWLAFALEVNFKSFFQGIGENFVAAFGARKEGASK